MHELQELLNEKETNSSERFDSGYSLGYKVAVNDALDFLTKNDQFRLAFLLREKLSGNEKRGISEGN